MSIEYYIGREYHAECTENAGNILFVGLCWQNAVIRLLARRTQRSQRELKQDTSRQLINLN